MRIELIAIITTAVIIVCELFRLKFTLFPKLYRDTVCDKYFIKIEDDKKYLLNYYEWQRVKRIIPGIWMKIGRKFLDWDTLMEKI